MSPIPPKADFAQPTNGPCTLSTLLTDTLSTITEWVSWFVFIPDYFASFRIDKVDPLTRGAGDCFKGGVDFGIFTFTPTLNQKARIRTTK